MATRTIILFLALALVLPCSSQAGSSEPEHLMSVVRSAETGPFGLLGGVFFDEVRKRLYVADTTGGRILAYDSAFGFVSQFDGGGRLSAPSALVRDRQGIFYVIQAGEGAVLAVDMQLKTMEPLSLKGAPGVNAVHPVNLALDEDDNLYVADAANQQVLIFGLDRRYRGVIHVPQGDGLRDVKVVGGRVYVVNALKGGVCVYDLSGKLVAQFGVRGRGRGEMAFPVSLAVASGGQIHVLDSHRCKILVFLAQGTFLHEFSREGWREGRLHYPSYLFRNEEGQLFVVDRQNKRVSVFEQGR
ncbi:NHL repeat-containing protein [Desulfoplanes sp. PS50]|jgi:DNA-binding beta-propeller fold protein YncE